jgi:3',5'-cyclic AMP phosphodiesterase CpdA
MSSVSILHASDLHISLHKQLRSPLDQLNDLDDRWDFSGKGLSEKHRILKHLLIAWRKKSSASSYDPETLEALAEFIYEKARKRGGKNGETSDDNAELDAVILSGDLATTGTRDDIEKTHQFLTAPYDVRYPHKSTDRSYRGATLSALEIPVIYLPGNHDRYEPTRDFTGPLPKFFNPGGTNFDSVISDFRAHAIQVTPIESIDRRLKVIVFAVDFTLEEFDDHEGFYGWLAQGRAYSNIRKNLLAQTTDAIRENSDQIVAVLWAIHFPPYYPGIHKHSSLLAEDKLISLANSSGVTAILAGHTHKQLSYRHPFMSPEVYCCGTTTQFEPMRVGEGGQPDQTRGNFLQILKVSLSDRGSVRIGASHYRYSATRSVHGPSLMRWAPVP